MPLFLRVSVALCASLAVALSMVVTLNLLKYDETLRQLDHERAGILLSTLSHSIIIAHDLGLPLAANSLAEERATARKKAQGIEDLILFDHQGVILDASDQGRIGKKLPDAWRGEAPSALQWTARSDGRLLVGRRLHSSFGEEIGGLLAIISARSHAGAFQAALLRWPLKALGILLFSLLLSLPLIYLLARRLRKLVQLVTDEASPSLRERSS
ncbi:MAG TPA: hypothetical protein VKY54_14805 [Kiloniellales bacterium]|jgi:hypothetical protein|nr:hypothetical protein [Kiloniellales bacterium]